VVNKEFSICKIILPINMFHKNSQQKDNLETRCKEHREMLENIIKQIYEGEDIS